VAILSVGAFYLLSRMTSGVGVLAYLAGVGVGAIVRLWFLGSSRGAQDAAPADEPAPDTGE
jgi:hypothetical protein